MTSQPEFIERTCRCGYCKFCIEYGVGSKYIQVYVDNKPVTAGKTMEEAEEAYDAMVENACEKGSPYDLEMAGRAQ